MLRRHRQAAAAKQPRRHSPGPARQLRSEQGARRAWGIYTKRYPELTDHQMVISEAVVRGKHYWRVSAARLRPRQLARDVRPGEEHGGDGCFAYAEGRPLPGAIDTGIAWRCADSAFR